jgi:Uncharacterized protein containing TOPRIM domain, potential nuclease
MNFKFTVEDFLNDFGAGFVFLFGLAITNHEKLLSNIISLLEGFNDKDNSFILNGIFILIMVYITGLALSAITNFMEQDFYLYIDGLIRKTHRKEPKYFTDKMINTLINKPLFFIKKFTFFLFFRKWASIETMMRIKREFSELGAKKQNFSQKHEELLKKYEDLKNSADKKPAEIKSMEKELKKLESKKNRYSEKYAEYCKRHEGLQYITEKTVEEIFAIEKTLKKESSTFGMLYWYKSQFWQISSNAVFFIYIFNLFLFRSINFLIFFPVNFSCIKIIPFFSKSTIIYLAAFFLCKLMSPMYIKMYLRQIFRENNALEKIKKENSEKLRA